jgi:23S rRNA (guanine745-N1)-methyltransferase
VIAELVELLRCPHCARGLAAASGQLRCAAGHTFDVARHGHVGLAPGGGDSAPMVTRRESFLAAGHYDGLAEAVADAATGAPAGCVVDLGAGTGYYLARVLEREPERTGLALDVSRPALRRAARAHPRAGAVAADVWRALPLRDAVAGIVLSVFAPRNGAEIARILRPGGRLVVATPTDRHLTELVGALGLLSVDARKEERVARQLRDLAPAGRRHWEATLRLTHADVANLVGMGPSARHGGERAIGALPDPVPVTASVTVAAYRRG